MRPAAGARVAARRRRSLATRFGIGRLPLGAKRLKMRRSEPRDGKRHQARDDPTDWPSDSHRSSIPIVLRNSLLLGSHFREQSIHLQAIRLASRIIGTVTRFLSRRSKKHLRLRSARIGLPARKSKECCLVIVFQRSDERNERTLRTAFRSHCPQSNA